MSDSQKSFVITVSSRALFDMEESHQIFEKEGLEAYIEHERAHEEDVLSPGPALSLIKKILKLNDLLPEDARKFDVILLSRNSADSAGRIFNSLEAAKLPIERAIFTNGSPTSQYIKALGVDLFLSSNPEQVQLALNEGVGAATILSLKRHLTTHQDQIRIAFDGDAVIFDDLSEQVHLEKGLSGFTDSEVKNAHIPMNSGPLRPFLEVLHHIQTLFPVQDCPIRTALVTARGLPAHRRALNTLRAWGIRLDEVMFLAGNNKGPILKSFGPDLFFDDSKRNIESALSHDVPSGHVVFGVRNRQDDEHGFTGTTPVCAEVLKDPSPTVSVPKRR